MTINATKDNKRIHVLKDCLVLFAPYVDGKSVKTSGIFMAKNPVDSDDLSISVTCVLKPPALPFVIQWGTEKMNVTAIVDDVFTVTRAYDSTTAAAHAIDDLIYIIDSTGYGTTFSRVGEIAEYKFATGVKDPIVEKNVAGKSVVVFSTSAEPTFDVTLKQSGMDEIAIATGYDVTVTGNLVEIDRSKRITDWAVIILAEEQQAGGVSVWGEMRFPHVSTDGNKFEWKPEADKANPIPVSGKVLYSDTDAIDWLWWKDKE